MRLFRRCSSTSAISKAWFDNGLAFGCTACGKCCVSRTTNVFVNPSEVKAMAKELTMPLFEFVKLHTEDREDHGGDELLTSIKNVSGACSLLAADKRTCTVYNAKPLQCTTYPFWTGNLVGEAEWKAESVRCEGINNRNAPVISSKQIAKQLIMSQVHARGIGEDWTAAESGALLEESVAAAPDTYTEFLDDFASSYSSRILSEEEGVRVVETTVPASDSSEGEDAVALPRCRTTRRLEFVCSPHVTQTEMEVRSSGQLNHAALVFPIHRALGLLALLAIKSLEDSLRSACVAVIGAGGGALPSFLLSAAAPASASASASAPASALVIDAVEPSEEVLAAAFKFFGLSPSPAVRPLAMTGEEYLLTSNESESEEGGKGRGGGLDVVIIDACGGGSEGGEVEPTAPPRSLFSPPVLGALHGCLAAGGIVAVNVLGPREHEQNLISAVDASGLFCPVETLYLQGSPNRLLLFAAGADVDRLRLLAELLLLAKDAGVSRGEE